MVVIFAVVWSVVKLGEAPRNSELAAAPFLDFRLLFMSLSLDHVQAAIAQLDLLGALEHKDDQLTLTPLGRKMAAFPLEPKFAKVSDTISSLPFCTLQHPKVDS